MMEKTTLDKRHLICTVIAPNYISQALTLGESIATSMPDVDFRILVLQDCENVDFISRGIERYANAQVLKRHSSVTITDIDWQDFDIASASNQYELLELATSVKPALIRHYLLEGWERVTYLDPDIQVFNDFENVLDDEATISLTPHMLQDFPSDGRNPNQGAILHTGIFNLGFVSVRPQALEFLHWWSAKLQKYCTVDQKHGYFVDQRWMDWSVNLTVPQVIRDPGMNVSYWNLHERHVLESESGYFVKSNELQHQLYFYHYSGFDVNSLSKLSKYSDRDFPQEIVPISLLEKYAIQRKAWDELLPHGKWTIAGRLHGESLPEKWRHSMLSRSRRGDDISEDLKALLLNAETSAETALPPFFPSKCEVCGSCSQRFKGKSIEKLAKWFQGFDKRDEIDSLRQLNYTSDVSEYLERSTSSRASISAGLKVIGFFASPTGVGQCARNFLQTLDAAAFPVYAENIPTIGDSPDLLKAFELRPSPQVDSLPAVIAFVNADDWHLHVAYANRINYQNQNVAAVWAWEIEMVPEYFHQSMVETDQIFTISPYSADALTTALNHAVEYLPTFGEMPSADFPAEGTPTFQEFAKAHHISERYLLARFDSKSVLKRKNPEAVLDVWEDIEGEYPDLQLVIKSSDFRIYGSAELLERISQSPRVILIDKVIPEDLNQELMYRASAFISLHRAEGLGLNILEAITADVPAIFTNYAGITSILEPMGFPVDYIKVAIGKEAGPYHMEAEWAEPDHRHAVLQTRRALNARLSGAWEVDKLNRRSWVEEFYSQSRERTVRIAKEFLARPLKDAESRKSAFARKASIYLMRFLLLRTLPIWKLIPIASRTKMRPHAIRLYRRFF